MNCTKEEEWRECPNQIGFRHSNCDSFKSTVDGRDLGVVFQDSDGNWTYVNREPMESGALPSGITNSRASAINWLRMGDGK